MPMVRDQIVEQIRERTDIVDVIGSRVELRRSGSDFVACCPFHHEKTPSFHVNPSRQSFKCFGCGEGGDVFAFLMKHDGMTFPDALKMLGDRCGVRVEFTKDDGSAVRRRRLLEINAEASAFYMRCLKQMAEAKIARDYLASRDLGPEIVEAFQIGYAPQAQDTLLRFAQKHRYSMREMVDAGLLSVSEKYGRTQYHDRFRGRLMFSICDAQGRVVAFSGRILVPNDRVGKYVNSPETLVFQKSSILYALHKAQRAIANAPHRRAIICEGQIDTIRCHAAGFENTVASQGTAFTEEHVRILKRYADSVVMVFDRDKAGLKATKRTARLFLAAGVPVRAASLPEGEDPDSFIRIHGHDGFERVIEAAEEIIPYQYRLERANEADPESADGLGRISRELLETVAQCANAVHRARMLQQAAELLHLPQAALEEELRGIDAEKARREEREAALAKARAETQTQEAVADEIADVLLPDAETAGALELAGPDVAVEGAEAPLPSMVRPSAAEQGLCELLYRDLEHPDVALAREVATYVPEALYAHPYCRAAAHAMYLFAETDGASLEEVQATSDAEMTNFIGRLAAAPDRVSADRDVSPLGVAHDYIQALWRHRLQEERDAIPDADPADVEAVRETSRRRQRLTLDLRKMGAWETAEPIILARLRDFQPNPNGQ